MEQLRKIEEQIARYVKLVAAFERVEAEVSASLSGDDEQIDGAKATIAALRRGLELATERRAAFISQPDSEHKGYES